MPQGPVTLEELHSAFRQAQQDHIEDRTRLSSRIAGLEATNERLLAALETARLAISDLMRVATGDTPEHQTDAVTFGSTASTVVRAAIAAAKETA